MSNYATKKKLDHATVVDTSDLAAKNDFIASKAEVELDINKLDNVLTSLNNFKTKIISNLIICYLEQLLW